MNLAKHWDIVSKKDKSVRCSLCPRECVISEDKYGFCGVRKNQNGKLFSLVYGKPAAINLDRIEKKPFYHFKPDSKVLSFGTIGCNLKCKYCCNWEISQANLEKSKTAEVLPEQMVKLAKSYNADGIAYTYTEPTIFFEYAFDTAELAKKENLFNVFVTNGYAMRKPLEEISPYLDAAVINFKGFNSKFYKEFSLSDFEKTKQGAIRYKKHTNAFIEITNLIVPGHTDSIEETKKFSRWVISNFGAETPVHFIRFFPTYKMTNVPQTEIKTLEQIHETAKKEGLENVYLGNTTGKLNNTFCAKCGKVLVERNYPKVKLKLKNSICLKCGKKTNIIV